jgi:hypothetical protein
VEDDGEAIGFAAIFWSWSTLSASRIGATRGEWVDYSLDVSSDFPKRFPVSSNPKRR